MLENITYPLLRVFFDDDDDDVPTFSTDSTPSTGTTGDLLTFNIFISDNTGFLSSYVEYWFGTGSHSNVSMVGNGPYKYTIMIPSNSTSTLHYIFHAQDIAGNWNETSQKNVTITDNDKPMIGVNSTSVTGTTGDPFAFNTTVLDNIGVQNVTVEYWFNSGIHTNISMFGIGSYLLTISIPSNSTSTLHYIFHAQDISGNWNETTQKNVTITDDDRPIFGMDSTPSFGTTGDPITFNMTVSDNIKVQNVTVEYWFGSGIHANISMFGTEPYLLTTISIPSNSTSTLHYIFHVNDSADNWNETLQKDVIIIDNDRPVFGTDVTSITGTTGDQLTFIISARDNIGVQDIIVEYWFGSGIHANISMFGTGPYLLTISIPSNSTSTLHYRFHVNDSADNWNKTTQKNVTITDDDRPIFGMDSTPSFGTTGESLTFLLFISDNIGVHTVAIEYWYGKGTHENITMSGIGPYSLTISIPPDSALTLYYIFHAKDFTGNWNETQRKDVIITDNDKPMLEMDSTLDSGTTGDEFKFEVEIGDNIDIHEIWVEYWFGEGEHFNISMDGDSPFDLSIIIPFDSILDMNYIFHFTDSSENWNQTLIRNVQILDNDPPEVEFIKSPTESITGDEVTIEVQIEDNIGIDYAEIVWKFGTDGIEQKAEMKQDSGHYKYEIVIPLDSTKSLYYWINTSDVSGLYFSTSERIITVIDGIFPWIKPVMVPTVTVGDSVNITIEASDNIGIEAISWVGTPFPAVGNRLSGIVEETGTYKIYLSVYDAAGNQYGISFTLKVIPKRGPYDSDLDGMLDEWEIQYQTDPLVKDARQDPDSDDLTNLEEYHLGTDPKDDDTDDDGMPDGWEVDNGLDPLLHSSDNDTDEDGKTDLEEYQLGTDPNIKEKSESDSPIVLIIIIIIIFVVILILAGTGVGIFLFMKKKGESELTQDIADTQPEDQIPSENHHTDNPIQGPPLDLK